MTEQTFVHQALGLNDLEKVRLIEILFDSLDRPSQEVEQLWIEESETRYQAYKQGKIKVKSSVAKWA